MKVKIIKGPHFEERRKKAYEYLYQIIRAKVNSGEYGKLRGKEPVNVIKDEKS